MKGDQKLSHLDTFLPFRTFENRSSHSKKSKNKTTNFHQTHCSTCYRVPTLGSKPYLSWSNTDCWHTSGLRLRRASMMHGAEVSKAWGLTLLWKKDNMNTGVRLIFNFVLFRNP